MGKVLTNRSVNKEGLKIALQQAWQNIREVKIESLGDNVFMFKFAMEVDKRRVLMNGPWHFNNALIVFIEPIGIGDISKEPFTHTSFWVQLQNVPIICMDKEILTEISEAIGKVEEVETDANGEVMGQIIRLRVSVNITKPLKKIIMLETMEEQRDTQAEGQGIMQEDEQEETREDEGQIPITVQYEKLPEFCYRCGCIGHQYKECVSYKNQAKEDLPYGPWTKAQTTAERLRQRRERGKWNAATGNSKNESQSQPDDPKAKNTESQDPNQMKEPDLDIGAAQTRKIPGTEVKSIQCSKEMGLGTDSCKELEEVAREVNVNKGQNRS